jgi:hypothetical protein
MSHAVALVTGYGRNAGVCGDHPGITPDANSRPRKEVAERVAARHLHEPPVTAAARV